MPRDDAHLETMDFLLSKAARLDRALRSLPKADLKSLQASSHKRARKLLRSLSYPARPQANADTAENIQRRIDVLTGTRSTAVSSAKKMPPLTEALHMGSDMVSVQAFAIEARQPLAEDLCTEALQRTGANLDWVQLEPLHRHCDGRWPSEETFTRFYDIPAHLRPKPRTPPPPSEPSPEPLRPTIAGIEEAKAFGGSSDLLAALLQSLAGDPGIEKGEGSPSPRRQSQSQNVFQATAKYKEACHSLGVMPLSPPPVFGEVVEISHANLDETKHCYALAEAMKLAAPKQLKVESSFMTDLGAATLLRAALQSRRLEVLSLSGLAVSFRACLAIHSGLRSRRGVLQRLDLDACGLGVDLEEDPELPPQALAVYQRSRELLEPKESDPTITGDVGKLLSLDLQDLQRKERRHAAPEPEPGVEEPPSSQLLGDEEEGLEEEAEEPVPTPVLLPIFAQLSVQTCPLRKVNLSQSPLSTACVQALASCLPTSPLEVLTLDECGLTDDGLEELAINGIIRNRMLLELSLRLNRFSGDAGALNMLLRAAKRHSRLAHLDLGQNVMRPECIPELCELLQKSVSLLCLHLLGSEASLAQDNVKIQAACYRWVAETSGIGLRTDSDGAVLVPEPAPGDEYSELILGRAPHVEGRKDWLVSTPLPKRMEVPASLDGVREEVVLENWMQGTCWLAEAARKDPSFRIPEELPDVGNHPEEEIGPWSEEPARTQALMDCCEMDLKYIYLVDLCHVDDEEGMKAALRDQYHLYYECYARFAGRSQWPFIRYVDMYNVFEEARLVDRIEAGPSHRRRASSRRSAQAGSEEAWSKLSMADVHQMVVRSFENHQEDPPPVVGNAKGSEARQRNDEGAPVSRPQFFEVMLRAAVWWGGRELSSCDAVRRFALDVIADQLLKPPVAPFPRGLALRPGEYYETLLQHKKTLHEAWERFGYSETAFQRLAQLVRLCDRSFSSKHVASIYALAKKPNPDFRGTGSLRGLKYPEFCEAVGRLAIVWCRNGRTPSCCPREDGSTHDRGWPPQPQVGQPVREKAMASRLDGFVARLAQRMKPSARASTVIL